MPDVDDAIELLTDPAYRGMAPEENGLVPMRGGEIISKLVQMGVTEDDAPVLANDAITQLGGENRSRNMQRKGLRPGPTRHQYVLDYWVPASKLRTE